jgi:excinuclease ABC subunit C
MDKDLYPVAIVEKLDGLPVAPGVYLFKDRKGTVVYVGKAKSLRSRVRSYFQEGSSDTRYFIPILQRTLGDLDTIVTGSEKEAMILENLLIKEHRPRYNIKLRDDKDYLSIRLAATHMWPRLDVVRRPTHVPGEKARYFGPYHSATAARRTLHLVNKHFQLRTCSDQELERRKRPCLQHQIKRCPAPCVYDVDKAWYDEQVDSVAKFLDGRHDELSRELQGRMQKSAREMRFELAAVYRDQLRAIDKVREEQRVVAVDSLDRDVLGLYREGDLVELALLYVRGGKLADVATFSIKSAEIPDEEIVGAFLAQHYGAPWKDEAGTEEGEDSFVPIPNEVILPSCPEGVHGIAEWLADRAGHKVMLIVPQRGSRVDLLALANDNAKHAYAEKRRQSDDVQDRLAQLQERLRLPTLPRRIECCDISHLGGGDTVGAIVAMKDGAPDKKHYRTFHVRGVQGQEGGDDYAAMYEVLARRFRRGRGGMAAAASDPPPDVGAPAAPGAALAIAEDAPAARADTSPSPSPDAEIMTDDQARAESEHIARADEEWELPDLFVVDGGRGQLAVAMAAAQDLGLHNLPIVALAKEKENILGETLVDRVYVPGQKNPINLKSHSASLFFLARARDEAHRFSNRARERLGKARRMKSALDDVHGIGPATKKALLKNLGSLAAVKRADDAALLGVPGVSARHVKALRRVFPAPAGGVPSLAMGGREGAGSGTAVAVEASREVAPVASARDADAENAPERSADGEREART